MNPATKCSLKTMRGELVENLKVACKHAVKQTIRYQLNDALGNALNFVDNECALTAALDDADLLTLPFSYLIGHDIGPRPFPP